MAVVQELSDRDMANRRAVAERLIRISSDDAIALMTAEAHFHLSGRSLLDEGKFTKCTCDCLVAFTGPYFFEDEDVIKCM
jgi:hypothetical protein